MDGPRRGGDFCLLRSRDARKTGDAGGEDGKLDDLIGDIADELRARPYELAFVAGGYQFRTKSRFADAIRARVQASLPRPARPN